MCAILGNYYYYYYYLVAPSAPVIESLLSLSSGVISVSWFSPAMPNGVIRTYQLIYFTTASGRGTVVTLNTSALELNITGLQPFTNYTVVVAAVTVVIGNESGAETVVTDEAGNPLDL